MAKGKFSEEQVLGVVKQLEAGRTAAEMARKSASARLRFTPRKPSGGMEPNEAQRLHHLEDENSRLKRLVADLSLDREGRAGRAMY